MLYMKSLQNREESCHLAKEEEDPTINSGDCFPLTHPARSLIMRQWRISSPGKEEEKEIACVSALDTSCEEFDYEAMEYLSI